MDRLAQTSFDTGEPALTHIRAYGPITVRGRLAGRPVEAVIRDGRLDADPLVRSRVDRLLETGAAVVLPGWGGGRASLTEGAIVATATVVAALDETTSIEGLDTEPLPPDAYPGSGGGD